MVEVFGYPVPWFAFIPGMISGIMLWGIFSWWVAVKGDGSGLANPAYTLWLVGGGSPRYQVFAFRLLALVIGWPVRAIARCVFAVMDLVRWLRVPTKSS
ncbi:MAG: hypothetical protein A3C04_02680 [Candidatus Wildermuthbacteria bacterium RIFCSPHIGHO2_02_FULL_45_25]|uniref:Uncharacterized protein n=1 Tax=Candidatus Wildermuthbacteria bacterium RIFCSPHIGHO2_02_FULL_45_25 TaxID=1802450 RepID=A0A1G2QYP5_9BACT|nr:MAG: hypothetical protein A3C04_02680 [Candidatus Wildermuthbacteria bacterium RIFCSPHIGHO2_02_FULL_45_25]